MKTVMARSSRSTATRGARRTWFSGRTAMRASSSPPRTPSSSIARRNSARAGSDAEDLHLAAAAWRRRWSQLVADVAEQLVAAGGIRIGLDTDRRRAVDHADDTATGCCDRDQHADRVRRRAEDRAHLGYCLDRVEHVDRESAAKHDHERVAGA